MKANNTLSNHNTQKASQILACFLGYKTQTINKKCPITRFTNPVMGVENIMKN